MYPHIYKTKESRELSSELRSAFQRLQSQFKIMNPAERKMLAEAFSEGNTQGLNEEIIYTTRTLPSAVFHDSVHRNNILTAINDAVWFGSIAKRAGGEGDDQTYQREMDVTRKNMRLLGEATGLCARWAGADLNAAEPYYLDYTWDSDETRLQILAGIQNMAEQANNERDPEKPAPKAP